jgi:hypothetical protein
MYVCMCLCVYGCVYVCMYVRMYVCMYVYMYECTQAMALRPKILVTAPSNAAVDAILMRIIQKGFTDGTLRR